MGKLVVDKLTSQRRFGSGSRQAPALVELLLSTRFPQEIIEVYLEEGLGRHFNEISTILTLRNDLAPQYQEALIELVFSDNPLDEKHRFFMDIYSQRPKLLGLLLQQTNLSKKAKQIIFGGSTWQQLIRNSNAYADSFCRAKHLGEEELAEMVEGKGPINLDSRNFLLAVIRTQSLSVEEIEKLFSKFSASYSGNTNVTPFWAGIANNDHLTQEVAGYYYAKWSEESPVLAGTLLSAHKKGWGLVDIHNKEWLVDRREKYFKKHVFL